MGSERAVICLIQMRRGRIVRALPTTLEHGGATEDEVLTTFLTQHYRGSTDIPRDVLLPIELDWREALEDFLNEMGTNRTRLYCPQKGDKRRQIELANQNALEDFSKQHFNSNQMEDSSPLL